MDRDKDKKKNDKPKGGINRAAFKHAIGMIESAGGKFLDNPRSSAAGRYHFLYDLIKTDPSMKGVSKREFMNDPELQDHIMDKAIDGKLKGYVGYESYAKKLKSQYETKYDETELAALIHFIGPGGIRDYLRDPEAYSVPGEVNLSPDVYVDKFRKHSPREVPEEAPVVDTIAPIQVNERARLGLEKKRDGVNIQPPQIKDLGFNQPQGLQFKETLKTDVGPIQDIELSNEPATGIIPLSEQVEGGTPSGLKVLHSMSNEFAQGGKIGSTEDTVIEFNEGGTHEQNPHGGIPIGVGANGKMNTVEEGETKFGDYIFSNRLTTDGLSVQSDVNENSFANGGDTDPDPDPKKKAPATVTKTFTDPTTGVPLKKDFEVPRAELKAPFTSSFAPHMKSSDTPEGKIQKEFADWYSDPEIRKRIEKQGSIPADRVDDFITKGVKGGISKGKSSLRHSDAEYDAKTGKIIMNDPTDTSTGVHEVLHRSGMDQALSKPLMDILGNTFDQKEKNSFPDVKRYLNQPHEAYGNFAEFRSQLGMKPGEKMTKEKLKKKVKENKLENENFYRTFDDDKILEALNTVARLYKRKNSKVKKELEFRIPKSTKLT